MPVNSEVRSRVLDSVAESQFARWRHDRAIRLHKIKQERAGEKAPRIPMGLTHKFIAAHYHGLDFTSAEGQAFELHVNLLSSKRRLDQGVGEHEDRVTEYDKTVADVNAATAPTANAKLRSAYWEVRETVKEWQEDIKDH